MTDVQRPETPAAAEFRRAMGQFATGVCVVAIDTESSGIAAMTINSFVSVSLDPLLVCWSLHNSSSQFDRFIAARHYAVSILAADQADHARRYAARGISKLDEGDFVRSTSGLPVIDGALGHFECRQYAHYLAGDHTMILGEVKGLGDFSTPPQTARPLAFFNGEFCSIAR